VPEQLVAAGLNAEQGFFIVRELGFFGAFAIFERGHGSSFL
jgi:hypothetical protein